ncbi:hypothetical protein DTO012A7_5177 [Penicillium roqueforti]|nr:hypothetical protein CBS147372_316 [Penicillium roqueforti]KAI2731361.1 hypothetical protein CBS147354_470 [Penicillium roqueforti]KAI3113949.1 hypothetical protein CBS147333_2184 [Penicillium roqueforti]KAI3141677.1 hypothetical protein CBS147326_1764 [Penicillium roqueforti]KAI3209002.1 hypothetical protein CBS147311_1723 [Penicillium roqueforti]
MIGQRFTSRVTKRAFISLRTKPLNLPPTGPTFAIPSHEVVDEERCPNYIPQHYYPARPGEILGNNYQLLAKIGWGTSSTVWLARDITRYRWQSERTVALKILNSCDAKSASDLLGIEETVAQKNPSHLGYYITRSCLESFELKTSDKMHLCLVYEAMREPMSMFQKRFKNRIIPLPIAKAYIQLLLVGLQYLHAECKIVHTDLKLANILMTFEDKKAIPRFIQEQVTRLPMHYKTDPITNHTTYQSYHGFGAMDVEDVGNVLPRITDFGSAWQFVVDPETKSQNEAVVLGYGWDFSTDIWNFGVLVWNIIEGTELFTQVEDTNGRYDAKSHLAQMIALLGPPPKGVIERADHMSQVDFPTPIRIEAGKLSKNARELFGGPYFDEEGKFLHEELIPSRKLEDTIPSLDDSEREIFLSFARDMLTWIPSERKTARELMEHPFLNFGGHVSKDALEGRS